MENDTLSIEALRCCDSVTRDRRGPLREETPRGDSVFALLRWVRLQSGYGPLIAKRILRAVREQKLVKG